MGSNLNSNQLNLHNFVSLIVIFFLISVLVRFNILFNVNQIITLKMKIFSRTRFRIIKWYWTLKN